MAAGALSPWEHHHEALLARILGYLQKWAYPDAMQRTPRPSSTSGLSSQGTLLLALTGAGLAVFLLFVLPRLGASRAAEPRLLPTGPEAVEHAPRTEPVQLVQPVAIESEQPAPQPGIATGSAETTAAPDLVAAEEKIEGPKLKHLNVGGGSETVNRRDTRAPNRERRKEQRKNAAEQGTATEEQPAGAEQIQTAPNPNRKRLSFRGGTGRSGPGKEKPKDR